MSRTPWNEANSFGNTFSNLFEGMENVEIANICCQSGTMQSRVIDESFQLTDKSVAKSIFGCRPGRVIRNSVENSSSVGGPSVPRKTFFYIMREAIWAAGHWKTKALKRFITDFAPDVLYLPIYRSHYMCQIDKYAIKVAGVPYAVHISDDVYGYAPTASWLAKRLQRVVRKDIRQIVKKAAYGEVFSPIMANEYHTEFKIRFYEIGKSVDTRILTEFTNHKSRNEKLKFVYTGNYGGERGSQLVRLAQSISETFANRDAVLEIYSATKADQETEARLRSIACVNLMGAVAPDKIRDIQQQADYLVHVEGFTPRAIYESRLSFSTKIIDYLLAGRPILAIGPAEVTSVHVLKSNDMAHVAANPTELKEILAKIANDSTPDDTIVKNGRNYLLSQRDAMKMKDAMRRRLQQLAEL